MRTLERQQVQLTITEQCIETILNEPRFTVAEKMNLLAQYEQVVSWAGYIYLYERIWLIEHLKSVLRQHKK